MRDDHRPADDEGLLDFEEERPRTTPATASAAPAPRAAHPSQGRTLLVTVAAVALLAFTVWRMEPDAPAVRTSMPGLPVPDTATRTAPPRAPVVTRPPMAPTTTATAASAAGMAVPDGPDVVAGDEPAPPAPPRAARPRTPADNSVAAPAPPPLPAASRPPRVETPPPRTGALASASPGPGSVAPSLIVPGSSPIEATGATGVEAVHQEVRRVVRAYAETFATRDVAAAASLWPGVDTAELGRAFRSVRSQDMSFDDCAISGSGTRMAAVCTGALTFVPRVGSPKPRRQRLRWEFVLAERQNGWVIDGVTASPVS